MYTRLRLLWHLASLGMLLGFAIFLAGFLTLVLPLAYWWHGSDIYQSYVEAGGLEMQLVAAAAAMIGYLLVRQMGCARHRVRKTLAPDAHALLARDARAPILYLRSFNDDEQVDPRFQVAATSNPVAAIAATFIQGLLGAVEGAYSTQEERLTKALRKHGPFIAIGDPREDLPDLGAARLYVPDESWRKVVLELMRRARLVVIRPGLSQNLAWEITQALAVLPPERLVFWLPEHPHEPLRTQAAYAYLQSELAQHVREPFPKWSKKTHCLCFHPQWKSPTFKQPENIL